MAGNSGRKFQQLSERQVGAMSTFAEAGTVVWDSKVHGLQLRFGKHRDAWAFYQERRIHGKRKYITRRLGLWPQVNVKDARKAALDIAANVAKDRGVTNRKQSAKFGEALDAYIERAKSKGKSGAWARNLEGLKRTHLAEFIGWTLKELSDAPGAVSEWHKRITKDNGPNIADQAARALRAIYNASVKLDRNLDLAANPCSAVEYNGAERSQAALPFGDFPKWYAAWQKIENPTRKAFHTRGFIF